LEVEGEKGVVDGLCCWCIGVIGGAVGRVDGRASCGVGGFLGFEDLVAVAKGGVSLAKLSTGKAPDGELTLPLSHNPSS
jgi:hypothetical protein